MHERLKNETRENHQQLETIIVGHIKAIRNPADYARLLETYYLFIHPIETSVLENFRLSGDLYHPVGKSHALRHDIMSLLKNYSFDNQLFKYNYINDHYSALGALYVLEGSSLGGQVISKMIGRVLGYETDAFRYFTFYGENTQAKWTAFKNYLAGTRFTDEQKDTVIRSANVTFTYFKEHFSNTYAT